MSLTNRRNERDAQLEAEKKRFPTLRQTIARESAERDMLDKNRIFRDNRALTPGARLMVRNSAEQEYLRVLEEQKRARAVADQAATQRR